MACIGLNILVAILVVLLVIMLILSVKKWRTRILIIIANEYEARLLRDKIKLTSGDYDVLISGEGPENAKTALADVLKKCGRYLSVINVGFVGDVKKRLNKGEWLSVIRVDSLFDKSLPSYALPIDTQNRVPITTQEYPEVICGTDDEFNTALNDKNRGVDIIDMELYSLAEVCSTSDTKVSFRAYKIVSDFGSHHDYYNFAGDSRIPVLEI